SPREEGREENDIVIELDRTTTEEGVYPIVLISYLALCGSYEDEATGDAVTSYASFMISEQGQQVAAENASPAPMAVQRRSVTRAGGDGITCGCTQAARRRAARPPRPGGFAVTRYPAPPPPARRKVPMSTAVPESETPTAPRPAPSPSGRRLG